MLFAEYGRMRIGRCVEDALGFLGCSSNVLSLADRKCSGRQSCTISIPDKDFDSTRPCNKEVKVYLEASYVCKRGIYTHMSLGVLRMQSFIDQVSAAASRQKPQAQPLPRSAENSDLSVNLHSVGTI